MPYITKGPESTALGGHYPRVTVDNPTALFNDIATSLISIRPIHIGFEY